MLHILITDDEKLQRKTISYILQIYSTNISTNIKISQAEDGNDAIEYIVNNPDTDVILMDITMPNCDGIEATKVIRMINTNVKIYAVTAANITSEFKIRCINAGMDGFFNKPFKSEYVINIIKNVKNIN